MYLISDFFSEKHSSYSMNVLGANRLSQHLDSGQLIKDSFNAHECVFIQLEGDKEFVLTSDTSYSLLQIESGGFLGKPLLPDFPIIWIPLPAIVRQTNAYNQIVSEEFISISGLTWESNEHICFIFKPPKNTSLDLVIWRLPAHFPLEELFSLKPIETEGYFLQGSHGCINKPADLYRHLIHGAVYDLRYSWPHNKKCFSENEAHALYTIFSGLEKQTGKTIYRYFQLQLVLSLIERQAEDGGWYHGMWTDGAECHYRLHTSGAHLLMDEFQRTACPQVMSSLEKAVSFLSKTTDNLNCGKWFLHDSLELSEQAMNSGPFKWIANKTFGKSVSNMLVLNTHLDTSIALNRYQKITGDIQYQNLVTSALNSTRTVLDLKTADWLYKPLFWAIGLTMLPTEKASQLPFPIRAIKRFAWQTLIKILPDIKSRFPRLVMPNGYIDRELSLRTWAIDYQTINMMDLARHAYAFPSAFDESILDKAMEFTQTSGLIKRYRELSPDKHYSVGFWSEALYYRCLSKPYIKYRQWLAEAMLECHDLNFGLSPSLLGTNGEALAFDQQVAMPLADNPELIMANLAVGTNKEFLLVNTSAKPITISWASTPAPELEWYDSKGTCLSKNSLVVNNRDWIIGTHQG
ncbi:MAG: hypothetical protein Q8Q45_02755 [Methylococcaceae bacterium]|nr:hypothetical protein [Methylococcaceae bacterium]MDP2393703.1 hypothetical protein [Methylococcaceae bacterium]MDP3390197.1 hypothetical protein [Methylococcaceae bacterium]MDP3931246.1 hypothetical protein [Methylococcaceae bacterium]MDZ4156124.1 hypothetical protein [Methylococcales bacterium]